MPRIIRVLPTFVLLYGCCIFPCLSPPLVHLSDRYTGTRTEAPLHRGDIYGAIFGERSGSLYVRPSGEVPDRLKRGESYASTYFFAFSSGDASIDAAAREGGIERIYFVDYTHSNILGIVVKYCVIVWGEGPEEEGSDDSS